MDYHANRRQAVTKDFKKDGIDTLLVTNPSNVRYLTGFSGDGHVVLTAKQYVLVTDTRYADLAEEECPDAERVVRGTEKTTPQASGEVLTKAGAKAVGVEADHATFGLAEALKEAAPKATFTPVKNKVEDIRRNKDAGELEKMREAIKAAERGFSMFKALLHENDTEKEMADALEGYIRRAGAVRTAFPTIVAVGDSGARPHARPGDKPLIDGSKLLVDWGAEAAGYKCDMTRSFKSPFGVSPNRKNKQERIGVYFDDIFNHVKAAMDAAVAVAREGATGAAVDAAARESLAKARVRGHSDFKLEQYFTHGLGHGIGLDVHELPRIRPGSTDVLETGMVITLEPAVYIPGWGGLRLEDMFLVRRDGLTRLTTLPLDPG